METQPVSILFLLYILFQNEKGKISLFSFFQKRRKGTVRKTNGPLFRSEYHYLFFRMTSWLPPSTILTEETSVSLAFFFRSARLVTPQLHMVDLIL